MPGTTIANPVHPVFANRLDEKWIADLTYIATHQGWLYLAGVMDLFSRRMVGIAMGDHMTTDLVEAALHMAAVDRQPDPGLLHHSDRGSQYTSGSYLLLLDGLQMIPSISGKGECLNAPPSKASGEPSNLSVRLANLLPTAMPELKSSAM